MTVSITCLVEGWVVRKQPECETCYWYEPGSEKEVEGVEPPYSCNLPARLLEPGHRVPPLPPMA